MIHEWALTRQLPEGDAILGVLDTHGGATCYTLERTPVAIVEGRYPVTLTVSQRATRGELWAPGSEFRLPLLGQTNGRTGIRMHAGNVATDSDGCILLGAEIQGVTLAHSRPAVIRIVNLLLEAEQAHDLVFLTVLSVRTPVWAQPERIA
jgi:hypothetical protein